MSAPAPRRILRYAAAAVIAAAAAGALAAIARYWPPLARDGIHDPASPAIGVLQEPAEALSKLPEDYAGNQVRWVRALEEGHIDPLPSLRDPDFEMPVLDLDIVLPETASMHMVRFPHKPHTQWLDCKNCHPKIFVPKYGGNPQLGMFAVLMGEYCGRCHGAVAFPLTECSRCHSVKRSEFKGEPGPQWKPGMDKEKWLRMVGR
ncbi:c(7)-type cytochrome triheme domain-containing protein [Inmirania thermothiophila]|uniref:C(7)-type cytochrome triheme protein n=1 Tax=Inmirania thermothiophila TaxID=1750597 RepID=A0A3N1Y326_9GAMM|nr:c(7)-type cytochrome triheme domain-containing protein [Inmirania thermothiophila]ROR32918.1 c(7)-type cytochrome triheme protein [Inmirania thermothiophila]